MIRRSPPWFARPRVTGESQGGRGVTAKESHAARLSLPLTFLGCIYYPWRALEAVPWLQVTVLINPLVYMCEGFRAALTSGTPHMSLWAVYGALALFAVGLTWVGIDGFERRTVS